MDLSGIFKVIKKNFSPRKFIDFKEESLHFEIEPLTSTEEMVVLESIKDVEGAQYIEALKRHTLACALKNINGTEIDNDVKYMDEEGEEKIKSHFLFMKDYISQFPSTLVEVLFEGYTHMVKILQKKIQDDVKYEKVEISEEIKEEIKEKFQEIKEGTAEGLTEIERLNKRVEKEISQEDLRMAQAANTKK